jgi:hypothetical protein
VFRLLRVAARNKHPIPWLLLENVRSVHMALTTDHVPSMHTMFVRGLSVKLSPRYSDTTVQVEAFLNRHEDGADAVVRCIVEAVEELGFRSWAYRIVNTAGGASLVQDNEAFCDSL